MVLYKYIVSEEQSYLHLNYERSKLNLGLEETWRLFITILSLKKIGANEV
jgi:hypothetical protein